MIGGPPPSRPAECKPESSAALGRRPQNIRLRLDRRHHNRSGVGIASSESDEHITQLRTLRASYPPLCPPSVRCRPLRFTTAVSTSTIHDDGNARDGAHDACEVSIGARLGGRNNEQPPPIRKRI